ncbi:hypothetical protein BBOV_II000915 [Babesia bovis T2Bo]|uniref:hypothetical protein n=1 Tax=Babesia bovis T2Bo TaxID=484906 RepID=UPI001C3469EC|nr:hypothetical protein BBOV_II000915 [Babesia bovis T2Bo]KAG6440135.1 hypothetical protein BBOV_II000915 [Babesia bovis T2Bo]
MVAFNMLWKLCVVVAFGLSATAISTDVAQEQPKKEALDIGISGKEDQQATELVEVTEPTKTDIENQTETVEPPKSSLEWYSLHKRATELNCVLCCRKLLKKFFQKNVKSNSPRINKKY